MNTRFSIFWLSATKIPITKIGPIFFKTVSYTTNNTKEKMTIPLFQKTIQQKYASENISVWAIASY